MGCHLHLAQPHGHIHHLIRVQRVPYIQQQRSAAFTVNSECDGSLCEQVLGPVSAALRLLRLLAGQHGDEHNMAAAVGQRVRLLPLLVTSDAQTFGGRTE